MKFGAFMQTFLSRHFKSPIARLPIVLSIMLAWNSFGFCSEINDGTKVKDQSKVVVAAEEPHHQLVLENEYTRVFHVAIDPKISSLMHQHDRDCVQVMIGFAKAEMQRQGAPSTEGRLYDGEAVFTKGPFVHRVTNAGDSPFVNLIIEVKKPSTKAECGARLSGQALKRCSGGGGGDFNSASKDVRSWSYDREFETDSVSADLVKFDSTYIVDRIRPLLLVALTPVTAEWTQNSTLLGEVPETKMLPGNVFWIPMNTKVRITSKPGQEARFVMIEFK
jgi:hypothetical protein